MAERSGGLDRPKRGADDELPVIAQRPDPIGIRVRVGPSREGGDGGPDIPMDESGGAVVERMRELDGRLDPLEPVRREVQLPEQRRRTTQRMYGAAHVVDHARQG